MKQGKKSRLFTLKRNAWKKQLKSLDEAIAEIMGEKEHSGKQGKIFEVAYRLYLMGELERTHPQGVADIVVKSGVTLEVGHRCKALTEAIFDDEDEALEAWNNTEKPMRKASHVAYSPTGEINNGFKDTRIYKQREFISILEKCNLIRAKRNSAGGKWKIAIQTFYNSDKKNRQFLEALNSAGETSQEFIARMFA